MLRHILLYQFLLLAFSCNQRDPGEIAHIKFNFSGCFGSEQSTISVKREKNILYAEYSSDGNLVKRVPIQEAGMKSVNNFFKSLRNAQEGSQCTIIQSCFANLNGQSISKRNIDCDWNEYFTLKDTIFGL